MNKLRKGFIVEGLEFYESPYEGVFVTTNGIVWNRRNEGKRGSQGEPIKGTKNVHGYLDLSFSYNGKVKRKKVHRLIAETFIPIPEELKQYPKLEINHKDENKQNNAVENLEWCTTEYNSNYGTRNERVGKALSIPIVGVNKKTGEIVEFPSAREAERQLGIHNANINKCLNGKVKSAGGFIWYYKEDYYKKE